MDRHHHRLRGREQRYQLDPQDRPCPIHVRRYHDRRHWSHRLHGGGLHPHHVRPRQPQRDRHRLRQRLGQGRHDQPRHSRRVYLDLQSPRRDHPALRAPPRLRRHRRRLLPHTHLHTHACHAHTNAHAHTDAHGHAHGDAHGHAYSDTHGHADGHAHSHAHS